MSEIVPVTSANLDEVVFKSDIPVGYTNDLTQTRRHHEIYLSDVRKTAPDKLKTVIRHPIRKL